MLGAISIGLICLTPVSLQAQAEPDEVVTFATADAAMNKAVDQASRTLPLFLTNTVDDEGFGLDGGFLKVGFSVDDANMDTENIWGGPFLELDEINFVGLLANQPAAMPGLKEGDKVSFTYDMIVDSNLAGENGLYYGEGTTQVVIRRLPQKEAAAYAARFAESPAPVGWE